jgi:hypothetical protein
MNNSIKLLTGLFVIYTQFMAAQITQDKVNIEKTDTTEVANMSRYNYFPNLQAYYDNKTSLYIYKVNGIWIHNTLIPPNYKGYGLRNGFHVVIDNYSGDEPYSLLTIHKLKYPADYSTKRKRIVVVATE